MAAVTLRGVEKRFGAFTAVAGMDLAVRDGEFVAVLGPSGCGKTTTMNVIAGLERPTAGTVSFDDEDVTRSPIQKRGVGFVFQNYAIFTHMTVRQNLAFGLEMRRRPTAEIDRKVDEMATFMTLAPFLDELAGRLSVNTMQKLAIGRSAIVEPRIFLLDEPLSNLDAAFRERMRADLRQLQRALKQTMVYVTHDQIEAMGLADRISVMNEGRLQQFDTPAALYDRPANTFVARFLGAPPMNLIPADLALGAPDAMAHLCGDARSRLRLSTATARVARDANLSRAILGIRPEALALTDADGPDIVRACAALVETVGRRRIVHFTTGPVSFVGVFQRDASVRAGEGVGVHFDPGATHLFDPATGLRIAEAAELRHA